MLAPPPVGGTKTDRFSPLAYLVLGTGLGGLALGLGATAAWLMIHSTASLRVGLVVGLGTVAALAVMCPSLCVWIPERSCQVPGSLTRTKSMRRTAFLWGLQLGIGVRSFVVTPAFYGMLAVAACQRHPQAVSLVCLTYGLVRGAAIAFVSVRKRRFQGPLAGPGPGIGLERALRVPMLFLLGASVLLLSI